MNKTIPIHWLLYAFVGGCFLGEIVLILQGR